MKKFRMNIDGKEVFGLPGQTILEVARENDIRIPTLCFDERTEIYGACGVCVVEVEGNPKMVKACATEIGPNMVVKTSTERVIESRKTNLELLLTNHVGDCRPPCLLGCPAGTDCQGYVGLIANGRHHEAVKLIKDKIPLPASIGRVCPHPCEDKCRRAFIEEPVSIAWLKRFAADTDLAGENPFLPDIEPPTGKKVAIVGGGPLGLSSAYFLRQKGHDITIYESMPKLGGMLRYGIPEYRLPKEVLDMEIGLIEEMGVELRPNTRIGTDLSLEALRNEYDAVLIGIGAWVSTGVRCPGEDALGVVGGIDFLRKVVRNEEIELGEKVAIVGGGNTAMDACRTAVRLGAKKVYNVYRRTKDEMPADRIEIIEAEEEGVIFKNLTNPLEIIKDDQGHVKQMHLQVMELGEPDQSGRRAPKPVEGKTEMLDVDTVILAIGQAVDSKGFDGVELTKWKGIACDTDTFMTSIPGVFAGGDCGNDKISIAVEAIADANKASEMIDAYLNGEELKYENPYLVQRHDLGPEDFEDRERKCRPEMTHLAPEDRNSNFLEIVAGYDEEEAVEDASRCLECGCHDYFECQLIRLAQEYKAEPDRFTGKINETEFEDDHPFIIRDPNKCILCGLCVRVCSEVVGVGALGLVDRGFNAVVQPALQMPLSESGCVSCGQCVSVCPTGALGERLSIPKPVPLDTEKTDTVCPYCSIGCSIQLETYGDMLIRAVPDMDGAVNKGLICGKGKFGFDCANLDGRLFEPLVRENGGFRSADYHETFILTAKKAQAIGSRYGKGAVAVSISDRCTNEETYVIKRFADAIGAGTLCFNHRESGLQKVLGFDVSPNTIDELISTNVILSVGFDSQRNPVLMGKLLQAAKNGAKVIEINPAALSHLDSAYGEIYTEDGLDFLKQILKALMDMGRTSGAEGFDRLENSLKNIQVSDEARDAATLYGDAKKAMIVFQQNVVSTDTAVMIANLAVVSGHIGSPRDGILQLKAKNNSQGLVDLGITAGAESLDGVKALLIFGEDPEDLPAGLEFLMVTDTHMTETAEKADVVFPGTGFASAWGTFTNSERRLQVVNPAVDEEVALDNWEIACELARVFEIDMEYNDTFEISEEMDRLLPGYRYAILGEAREGGRVPETAQLLTVGDGAFVQPLKNTDNLMNVIDGRLPTPAEGI